MRVWKNLPRSATGLSNGKSQKNEDRFLTIIWVLCVGKWKQKATLKFIKMRWQNSMKLPSLIRKLRQPREFHRNFSSKFNNKWNNRNKLRRRETKAIKMNKKGRHCVCFFFARRVRTANGSERVSRVAAVAVFTTPLPLGVPTNLHARIAITTSLKFSTKLFQRLTKSKYSPLTRASRLSTKFFV